MKWQTFHHEQVEEAERRQLALKDFLKKHNEELQTRIREMQEKIATPMLWTEKPPQVDTPKPSFVPALWRRASLLEKHEPTLWELEVERLSERLNQVMYGGKTRTLHVESLEATLRVTTHKVTSPAIFIDASAMELDDDSEA